MKKRRAGVFWISTAGLAVILFLGLTVLQAEVVNVHADVIDGKILLQLTEEPPAVDHSQFTQLSQEFGSGSDVTKACLSCHLVSAQEVMATSHWTWEYTDPSSGELLGKKNIINNFCINPQSNEPRCTSCHVGYGWKDNTFDFTLEENVDCLVCHETSGTYKKYPSGAGHPAYEDTLWQGQPWPAVDLNLAVQSVGIPTLQNCGSCHFYGGGGDAVKHGELDSSLLDASYDLDVHMSQEGAGFDCVDCHITQNHQIAGARHDGSAEDEVSCSSCHSDSPHEEGTLNFHTTTIACQTCHIPEFGRGRTTKMYWDWSSAGQLDVDGNTFVVKDENGDPVYDTLKGSFFWSYDVTPEYIWSNGEFDYIRVDETIDTQEVVFINKPLGNIDDTQSKIYPVKAFRGWQPYDAANETLVIPALFPGGAGGKNAFWASWDWNLAIQAGMNYAGYEYGGYYAYVDTLMVYPVTHMVPPASEALSCADCHVENGVLDFVALGFAARAVELSRFPPGPLQEETAEVVEMETIEEEPQAAAVVLPTAEPKPTFEPPFDPAAELPPQTAKTGIGIFNTSVIIILVALILGIIILVVLRRRKNAADSANE